MPTPTISQIRDQLWDNVQGIKEGTTTAAACNAMTNAIGKILSSVKLQMDYCKLTGKQPDIALLIELTGHEAKAA